MTAEVGTAFVDIRPDLKGFGPRLQAGVMPAVNNVGRRIGTGLAAGMGATLAKGGAIAGAAVGLAAIGASVNNLIGVGIEYDRTFSVFKSVTTASAAEMLKARAQAQLLGNDLKLPGVSAAGAAAAMTELAKAGLTTQQAIDASRGALALSIAAQTSEAQAATITANALLTFGLKAKEATRVTDLLAGAANASSASMTDVAYALSMGGTAAKSAGVPIEDTITALAMLANAGIRGSDAGTLLKSALTRLGAPTKKALAEMKKLGINIYDADGKFVGMRTAVAQLEKGLGPLTDKQKQQALATIFGADAQRFAGVMADAGVKSWDKNKKAVTRSGQAASLAAAQNVGLGGALDNLQSTLEGVGLKVYEKIQPALTDATKSLTTFVGKLPDMASKAKTAMGAIFDLVVKGDFTAAFRESFGQQEDSRVVDVILTIREALVSFWGKAKPVLEGFATNAKAALPPVITAFKNLATFLQPLVPMIQTVGKALITGFLVGVDLLGKALPIVANALAAVTGWLARNRDLVYAVAAGVLAFVGVLGTQIAVMKGIALTIKVWQLLKGAILSVKVAMVLLKYAFLSNPIGIIIAVVMALVAAFIYLWKNNEGFRKFWIGLWDKIKAAASAVANWFTGTFVPGLVAAWNWIRTGFTNIGTAINNFLTRLVAFGVRVVMILTFPWRIGIALILAVVFWLWSRVYPVIHAFITRSVLVFRVFWARAVAIFTAVRNFIMGVWNAVVAFVQPIIAALVSFIVQRWNNLRNNVMRAMSAVRNLIQTAWNAIWGFIGPIINRVVDFVSTAFTNIVNAIRERVSGAQTAAGDLIGGVWDTIHGWIDRITGLGGDIVQGLINGITGTAGRLHSAVMGFIEDNVPGPIRKLLGIASPSKVLAKMGQQTGQGFIGGLTSTSSQLNKAVTGMVGQVTNGFAGVETGNTLYNARALAAQRLKAANLAPLAASAALAPSSATSTSTTDARITINGDVKAADVGDFENQMFQRRRLAALAGRVH